MSKIKKLVEQTSFLLEKQKEIKQETHRIFSELLAFVQENIQRTTRGSENGRLFEKIYDLLASQAQRLADEAQEDIQVLQENLGALTQIQQMGDSNRVDELLATLVDDSEELPDTQVFKREVLEELAISKGSLLSMIEDVKAAIKEGEADQIIMLLEAMALEQEEADQDDDHGDDDHEDDDCDDEDECGDDHGGGCGTCPPGGCKNCTMSHHGGKDVDLSSFLSPYEMEMARDLAQDKKTKKKKS